MHASLGSRVRTFRSVVRRTLWHITSHRVSLRDMSHRRSLCIETRFHPKKSGSASSERRGKSGGYRFPLVHGMKEPNSLPFDRKFANKRTKTALLSPSTFVGDTSPEESRRSTSMSSSARHVGPRVAASRVVTKGGGECGECRS